jgi:hypothetical protein
MMSRPLYLLAMLQDSLEPLNTEVRKWQNGS